MYPMSQQKLIGVFVLKYQFKPKNLIFEAIKHLTRPSNRKMSTL